MSKQKPLSEMGRDDRRAYLADLAQRLVEKKDREMDYLLYRRSKGYRQPTDINLENDQCLMRDLVAALRELAQLPEATAQKQESTLTRTEISRIVEECGWHISFDDRVAPNGKSEYHYVKMYILQDGKRTSSTLGKLEAIVNMEKSAFRELVRSQFEEL